MLKPANKRLSNTGIGATRPRMRDASGGFVRGRARALTGPLPRRSLSAQPRTTRDEAAGHGRAAAVEAALASAGRVDAVSVAVGAARIAVGGEATCDEPADSAEHDVAAGTGRWERWGACGEGARALEALAHMTPFFDEAIDAFPESSAPGRPKVMAGVIARGRGGRGRGVGARAAQEGAVPPGQALPQMRPLASVVSRGPYGRRPDAARVRRQGAGPRAPRQGVLAGRGKTHLAVATGAACAGRGMRARLLAAAGLVPAPLRARSEPRLGAPMPDLSRAGPPVIGETGHVPPDADGPRPLSQVMSGRHERRSTVIATNVGSSGWGAVSGDDRLAAAAIDRIAHHSRLVEFNGGSRRMDEALMLGESEGWERGRAGAEIRKSYLTKHAHLGGEPGGRHAPLRPRQQPHGVEPAAQVHLGVLHGRPDRHRELVGAPRALPDAVAVRDGRARRAPAPRALPAVRPPDPRQPPLAAPSPGYLADRAWRLPISP